MSYQKRSTYLAGPITGLTYETARNGWRADFARMMEPWPHIELRSPMRAKQFLKDLGIIQGTVTDMGISNALALDAGITTRDFNDVKTCDAMIANFLGARIGSLGTAWEFGAAYALQKPIIMVIENNGVLEYDETDPVTGCRLKGRNPHWHGMMRHAAGYKVDTLEEAAYILGHILTPGI